jgi:DNA-binding MarR family transcriptional regulator
MIEESTRSERAQRVVEAMARYGHLVHAVRIARLGSSSFWVDLTVTLPQLKALGVITAAGPAGRSGRALAEILGVGPSAITPLVDKLVDHGYVSRHEDPVDRRILRVRTTPAGLALLEKLNTTQLDELAQVVERIDPAQLPIVEEALGILASATQLVLDEHPTPAYSA